MVKGRPACFRRMPARIPAMPQPMTTTGEAALTSSGISSPQATAPVSPPSNCRSSNISPASRPSSTGRQPRNDIISSSSSRGNSSAAATVAVGRDRGQCPAAHLRLLIRRDATLDVQGNGDPRSDVATDPRGIARHVDEWSTESAGTLHVLECRRDRRVVICERFSCVGVPIHFCPLCVETPCRARPGLSDDWPRGPSIG